MQGRERIRPRSPAEAKRKKYERKKTMEKIKRKIIIMIIISGVGVG